MSVFGEHLKAIQSKRNSKQHQNDLDKQKKERYTALLNKRIETYCRTEIKNGVPIQYVMDTVRYQVETHKEVI